jgi:signal transduction histidine kinase
LLVDTSGITVIPVNGYPIGSKVPTEVAGAGLPVNVDGKTVGKAIVPADVVPVNPAVDQLIVHFNQSFFWVAVTAVVFAAIAGIILAGLTTAPLKRLTMAIERLASGYLGEQVPVRTKDEIGDLAAAFNNMSAQLAASDALRRQMTADIAHELRGPLGVISGTVEALLDGVLAPTSERLQTLDSEVRQLGRLVDDLRLLSLADAGELALQPTPVAPSVLLERVQRSYQRAAANKNITLTIDCEDDLPDIDVDAERLIQVLGNLVANALRQTPRGRAHRAAGGRRLGWRDIHGDGRRRGHTGRVAATDLRAFLPGGRGPGSGRRRHRAGASNCQSNCRIASRQDRGEERPRVRRDVRADASGKLNFRQASCLAVVCRNCHHTVTIGAGCD